MDILPTKDHSTVIKAVFKNNYKKNVILLFTYNFIKDKTATSNSICIMKIYHSRKMCNISYRLLIFQFYL